MSQGIELTSGAELRVMVSNIWGEYFGNPAVEREDAFLAIFKRYSPDVLALQEVCRKWWASKLIPGLSEEYGVVDGNPKGNDFNYTPLLYKKSRLELVDSGWVRYHAKLDRSKCVTWGVFKDKVTGKVFCSYSTHYWYKGGPEHDYIRTVNAEVMSKCLLEVSKKYNCPVVGGGDFNCNISSDAFAVLRSFGFESAQEIADVASPECSHHGDPVRGEDGKYRGFLRKKDNVKAYSIDHIVVLKSRVKVLREHVILDQDALDASDHSPIFADIVLK